MSTPNKPENGIVVDRVSKTLGGKLILNQLSLVVASGEIHVLLGLSGSGKSTLLRLIMGLATPDTGTIRIANSQLDATSRRQWVQAIGYIPQDSGLFPHLSAEKNITLVARTLDWEPAAIESRLKELLDLTSLERSLLQRYPRQLSGGQRQRIALMRAVFLNPHVMILDEPFGALDPIIRAELQNDLRTVFTRLAKTVLMVTHDLSEAAYFAQHVTLLKDGQVAQTGTLAELLEQPANSYVTKFIGVQRPIHLRGWPPS